MMQQFNALKRAYPDCILFFRAGDFYEMFGDDALAASEILQITLTTRNRGSEHAVPMCGVPYHAYEPYLHKLVAAGRKVALCEQMETPAQAKGLVRREVVRVVTPGTALARPGAGEEESRYLVAVEARPSAAAYGVALVDLSTGQFEVQEFPRERPDRLYGFLERERPREVLLPEPRTERERTVVEGVRRELLERFRTAADGAPAIEQVTAAWFDHAGARKRLLDHLATSNLAGFGLEGMEAATAAAGALLAYLVHTQKCELTHLTQIRPRNAGEGMWLDEATLAHLEVFAGERGRQSRHTLFAALNHTRTPMGARLLRQWLAQPLLERAAIEARLEAVGELCEHQQLLGRLREAFLAIRDLERLVARVTLPGTGIADMVGLREALAGVQRLPELFGQLRAPLLHDLSEHFDPLEDVSGYLRERFLAEPSLKLQEGGYIGAGVLPELDQLRALSRDSRAVISALETRERERTAIGSLKVRFNRVFGYYIEVPRTHQAGIPAHYARKQTLVNAERYTTTELEELEHKILGAEERCAQLEAEEFQSVRHILGGYARRLRLGAHQIATVDALGAFAWAALQQGYSRPVLRGEQEPRLHAIQAGRHPVIERIGFDEPFIPNDLELDDRQQQIVLITGPNMAGKSTVMRQVALIQLMAQAGSFVPAARAELSLVDRIFTRVGASDNLSRGQSTFLLEMNEAANILNNATARSLVVLDEIGRGTSTYDGISIAWAMVEALHALGAATLFATHYHELTQLARELPRVKNFNIAIREEGDHLVFTRKLQPGEADKSYGIQVAKLAGLPEGVVARAHEVMEMLVAGSEGTALVVPPPAGRKARASPAEAARARQQLSFLTDVHPLLEEVRTLDVERMTPLDALRYLFEAQARLRKGDGR
ncbi:MAG: DNA mismatch repair protein MutS [Candidatus Lambdaproteobacteria bacterium]|nr:DNA mismatch repair protein MutS [Candidatus Lambdaproteobacteria bacterium]